MEKSTEKVLRARNRILKAFNHSIQANVSGGWYLSVPGLKIDDFNRAGLPNIVKISRLGELYHLMHQTPVVSDTDDDETNRHRTLFSKGRLWNFSPKFYNLAATNFPMTLFGSISRVGQSSFDVVQRFYADDIRSESDLPPLHLRSGVMTSRTEEPMFSCITRLVYVNTKTRRSYPLTDGHRQMLAPLTVLDRSATFPRLSQPVGVPNGAFKCRANVRFDDLDHQFHANQASYLLYATECAAEAAQERYYSRIVEDVAFYPIQRAYGIYLTEALVGDELEVSSWEDAVDKMRLHFVICKRGTMIYYAQINYMNCRL